MDRYHWFAIGVIMFFSGLVFNFTETWWFGWNLKPQSTAELICDYISFTVLAIGVIAIVYAVDIKGRVG